MLFYNLDTPDLIGSKYPHSSLEKWDAAEAGMERGAVLASLGSSGYYKAPPRSKELGRMHRVLEYPRQKDSPVSPFSSLICL